MDNASVGIFCLTLVRLFLLNKKERIVMVLGDIAVMPLRPYGTEEEMYKVVDECIELIKKSGLKYEIGANSTTVEGDLDRVFDLAKKVHLVPFELGCERVITIFRVDQKKGGLSIDEKLKHHR